MSETHIMLLLIAIRHQNIIGWDLVLKGFRSRHWEAVYFNGHPYPPKLKGSILCLTLQTFLSIKMLKALWDNCK
jgi:hypothetical protein